MLRHVINGRLHKPSSSRRENDGQDAWRGKTKIHFEKDFFVDANANRKECPCVTKIDLQYMWLNQVIKSQDERVYNSVQSLRGCARKWRDAKDAWVQSEQFGAMVKEVKTYDPERLHGVARVFTHFLALSNSAENVHKGRRMQQHLQVQLSTRRSMTTCCQQMRLCGVIMTWC